MQRKLTSHALKGLVKRTLHFLVLGIVVMFMLMPIGWMLGTSMREAKNSFRLPPSFFPTEFNLTNYRHALNAMPFFQYVFNSLIITVISGLLMILFTSMAAYAFSRISFKGRDFLFTFFLAGLMIPMQSIIVPDFLIIRGLNLIDTQASLVLISIYYPLGLFMMRQFMMTIPKSYDEAAYCDGASKFTIFIRIILPMSKSVLMVTFVMHFIKVWNDFFSAMIFINSQSKMTLPLGIRMLNVSNGGSNMPLITAAVVLSLIPPLLFYVFGQRYLVQGTMMSGVKS